MRVLILGAGIAGLSTAHLLKRESARRAAPLELTIFEATGRPGGRVRTDEDAGYRIEWAANGVQGAEGAAAGLVEDLGLSEERIQARPDSARRYVAKGGSLHLLPTSPAGLFSFGALSARGKLRLMAEPIFARRIAREESVLEFASRHVGGEAARTLVGAAVRGIYAGDPAKLSLDATFPAMRRMEQKHRSLLLAAARERRKPGGRALWSLRGGMEQLVGALAASAGSSLRLHAPALALGRAGGSGASAWRVNLASGEEVEADAVVVATPPRAASALLRPLDPEIARHLSTVESAGLAVVVLAFRSEAFRSAPDGYGFLVAPGEDLEILGAVFESNLFPERAPEGRILVRVMIGGTGRPDLLTRSDADLVGLAMRSLDRILGLKSGPERTWVVRHMDAIPQYGVGHKALLATLDARLRSLPGLHLAGSGYRGVSVASLVENAGKIAAGIVAERGVGGR